MSLGARCCVLCAVGCVLSDVCCVIPPLLIWPLRALLAVPSPFRESSLLCTVQTHLQSPSTSSKHRERAIARENIYQPALFSHSWELLWLFRGARVMCGRRGRGRHFGRGLYLASDVSLAFSSSDTSSRRAAASCSASSLASSISMSYGRQTECQPLSPIMVISKTPFDPFHTGLFTKSFGLENIVFSSVIRSVRDVSAPADSALI